MASDERPDWVQPNALYGDELADFYVKMREEKPESRWILRIKELRVRHNLSIFEAQKLALSDQAWRRWALQVMNSNQACRKEALSHIRANRENALIERDGFVFSYRDEG